MKESILLSSYSFGPRRGSETGTGWATAMILSETFNVFVVCAGHYRPLFEDEDFQELKDRGIHAVFHDDRRQWALRLPMSGERVYYNYWQKSARLAYEEIVKLHRPILAHHVTWGNGRAATSLLGLGIPVVFGPVGGFESGCWPLSRLMGFSASIREFLRISLIRHSLGSRALKRMYSELDLVLCCNPESQKQIRRLGAKKAEVMSNSGIFGKNVELLQGRKHLDSKTAGCFTMLFVGRLIHWKGEELAIRAAAALPDRNWKLVIVGEGGNLANCRALVVKLGIADCVEFAGPLPQEQVWNRYAESDLFIFPSLHDSGGNAVIEAMGAGLPVLCMDLGGPGYYIDESCGTKIGPGKPAQVIRQLAEGIEKYRLDEPLRRSHGAASKERCVRHFTWESRGALVLRKYSEVLGRHPETGPPEGCWPGPTREKAVKSR